MWVTYLVNGIAAIAAGFGLVMVVLRSQRESNSRAHVGFWLGVITVALGIVVDFPLKPGETLRSIWLGYVFAVVVFMVLVGLGSLLSWADE